MTMTQRHDVPPAPRSLQTARSGQRISLLTPPSDLIADVEVREAIALHGDMRRQYRETSQEIEAAEKLVRSADAQDLRARAAATLRGDKDPGRVETKKIEKKLEELRDRRLVLTQASDDAAVAVLNLVETRRGDLLDSTANALEPLRREFLATVDKLGELYEALTSAQAVRGWYATVPKGSTFHVKRAALVENVNLERLLEALRVVANADEISHEVKSPSEREAGQSAVKLLGEGDERYSEVNELSPTDPGGG